MLTTEQATSIRASIADFDRFIAKEEARDAELRPAKMKKLLEDYKAKRAELQLALDTDSEDCLTFPGESK